MRFHFAPIIKRYSKSIPSVKRKTTLSEKRKESKFHDKQLGWFDDILDWVGDVIQDAYDFVTFKQNFGHYSEPGKNAQGPYTLFDRTSGKSVHEQLQMIRDWIKADATAGITCAAFLKYFSSACILIFNF